MRIVIALGGNALLRRSDPMTTDVDRVYVGWGTPGQTRLDSVIPAELTRHRFAAGSIGPKVEAASRLVTKVGRRAIGSLADIAGIVGDGGHERCGAPGG